MIRLVVHIYYIPFIFSISITLFRSMFIIQGILLWRNIIRGAIQIPISAGWLAFTFKKQRTSDNQQIQSWYKKQQCFLLQLDYWIIGVFCAAVNALSLLILTILSKEPEHGLYMLYFFVIYLFVGIPFFFAFLITWITYFGFLASMFSLLTTEVIVHDESTGSQSFQLSAVYLLATNLLLSISAYSLERGEVSSVSLSVCIPINCYSEHFRVWSHALTLTLSLSCSQPSGERREFIHGMELQNQSGIIEGLISNLLPEHVTDKFRNSSTNDYIIAEQVEECTILFSDMVSFTKWASQQQPDVLIQRMHELYACFDDLCRFHRVYKVETIGDAYFVSSNCPIMAPDHANRCMSLGKSMMEECRKLDWAGYSPRMRIGIHTGSVMAGVVGRKMPRYHLFGGTALIAEELESSGKPDYLHISETTKQCLIGRQHDFWKFECRGPKKFLHGSAEFKTYLVDLTEFLHDAGDEQT